jgi:predicted nuclease with RNAse H fold
MNRSDQPQQFFIGWDVGGWNCDKNRESRDALVILDAQGHLIGKAWRGNLRKAINKTEITLEWLQILFAYCDAEFPTNSQAVLAIDTPLGFSEAFIRLITRLEPVDTLGQSDSNPYLFRSTEQFLFNHGLKPLSPVKDMIGSQASKGMHVLAKFAPNVKQCGVWTDGGGLTVIEAYPSACKNSAFIQRELQRYVVAENDDPPHRIWLESLDHQDKLDALACALLARAFSFELESFAPPPDTISLSEGWIWVPQDALKPIVKVTCSSIEMVL